MIGTVWANVPFNFWYHPLNWYMEWDASKSLHLYQALCVFIVVLYSIWNLNKIRMRYFKKQLMFRIGLMVLGIFGYGGTALMAQYEEIGNKGYRSTSYHQTLGERKGMERSYWGWGHRRRNVIGFDVQEDLENYNFRCLDYQNEIAPKMMESGGHLQWYPLCISGLEQQFVKQFYILLFIGILLAVISQSVTFEHKSKRKAKEL